MASTEPAPAQGPTSPYGTVSASNRNGESGTAVLEQTGGTETKWPSNVPIAKVPPRPADSRWPTELTQPPPPAPLPKLEPNLAPLPVNDVRVPIAGPKHPVVAALECVLDDRHEEAVAHLKTYDPATQEFFLRVLPTLSLVAKNKSLDTNRTALSEQMDRLRVCLQKHSEFAIPRVVFCENVRGYAIYTPLPDDHVFAAPLPDRPGELLQVYVELKDFASEAVAGHFETRLTSRVAILDESGKKKWSHTFRSEDLKLVSHVRLSDYYHNYAFQLPDGLTPGVYTLDVEVTDETASPPRPARSAIRFRVGSPNN